jgi:hypothetical protein
MLLIPPAIESGFAERLDTAVRAQRVPALAEWRRCGWVAELVVMTGECPQTS